MQHCHVTYQVLHKLTMRAWPVARSIFDVREANERTTSWIMHKHLQTYCQTLPGLPRAARPSERFAEGKLTMRAWPVARSIFDARPLVVSHSHVATSAKRPEGENITISYVTCTFICVSCFSGNLLPCFVLLDGRCAFRISSKFA